MKKKIRVALMTYTIDGREAKGTAVVARHWTEALMKVRDRFELTFLHYEKSHEDIYNYSVREVIFPEIPVPLFNRRSLRMIWYFLTTRDEYDVIQWFQPRLYPLFWLAPARHIFVAVHGAGDVVKGAPFNLMRHVFNWTLMLFKWRVSAALVGSEFAKNDCLKHYGFAPAQMHVVHYGVDDIFRPADRAAILRVRQKYGLPGKFLLNIARLDPAKNALRAMKAFILFAQHSSDIDMHFVNVGWKGSEKPLVDVFLADSPLKDRIHIVKYVETEDLPIVYSAAFALAFPLLNEGFGLPVLEAMACGTPVLCAETAFPDVARDEAVLVDAYSEESIADGIRRICSDAVLRETLKERGLRKVRDFTWEASGRKFIDVYERVLE